MEFHEDLADQAHSRFLHIDQFQVVEILDYLTDVPPEYAVLPASDRFDAAVDPAFVELVCRAFYLLIRPHPVQQAHEEIAVYQRDQRLVKQSGRYFEPGVLFKPKRIQRDHGNMPEARILQGLPYKSYIVGRPAASACLTDDHGHVIYVVFTGFQRLHDLSGDEDRRIAGVVVHMPQAFIDSRPVNGRQYLDIVSGRPESFLHEPEMYRRHLRRQYGVAFAHLPGKRHLPEAVFLSPAAVTAPAPLFHCRLE